VSQMFWTVELSLSTSWKHHLNESSPVIQQNTIMLFNALSRKADSTLKSVNFLQKTISKRHLQVRKMYHQLSILQLHVRAKDEYQICAPGCTRQDQRAAKNRFKFDINPAQDFMKSSLFVLDCIVNFAKNYPQHSWSYTKVDHVNSCRAGETLVRVSIQKNYKWFSTNILKIGELVDQVKDFHPTFFTHDYHFSLRGILLHLHRRFSKFISPNLKKYKFKIVLRHGLSLRSQAAVSLEGIFNQLPRSPLLTQNIILYPVLSDMMMLPNAFERTNVDKSQ
jgi:hypothetical protein